MSKRNKRNNNKSSIRLGAPFQAYARLVGRNDSFKLVQISSGVGCLAAENTGSSATSATNAPIDPFNIGSRCGIFANLYTQWRVRKMEIRYISDCTSSGVVQSVSGPTTTPSYGDRAFAMGFNRDPDVVPTTANAVVETGGFDWNTSRNGPVIRVPKTGWLWCSTSAASPSGIDLRMACCGNLQAAFKSTSTTASATYGRFEFSYDLEFRYPSLTNIVGLSYLLNQSNPATTFSSPVEMKDELEEKVSELTGSALTDSFMLVRKKKPTK